MEKKPSDRQGAPLVSQKDPGERATIVRAAHPNAGPHRLQKLANRWFDVADDERDGQTEAPSTSWAELCPDGLDRSGDRFLGILAACRISGCDVHFITEAEKILRHVRNGETLSKEFRVARDYLKSSGSEIVAILVFESGISPLSLDGALQLGLVGSGPSEEE